MFWFVTSSDLGFHVAGVWVHFCSLVRDVLRLVPLPVLRVWLVLR